ncbi:MAG: long-chain fatty acid--CoA ligase [Ardenticatenales bacterium]|nr:long-chain fatty acid--CoA ligase [Ardenticatenales bacterium]
MRETIPHMLADAAAKAPERATVFYPDGKGGYRALTTAEQIALTSAYSAALVAWGVAPGDRVAILSQTRYEWALMDRAILQIGAVTVGIYPTSTTEQCAYILNHSESKVLIAEDQGQLARLVGENLPALEKIVLLDEAGAPAGPWFSLATMRDIGAATLGSQPELLETRLDAIQPDDMAALVYTSGTTGPPKGVVLSQRNLASVARIVTEYMQVTADDVSIAFLPMAHILQRVNSYIAAAAGLKGYYIEDIFQLLAACQTIQPTTVTAVPRVFEKIQAGVLARVAAAPVRRRQLFHNALLAGRQATACRQRGEPLPFWLNLQLKFYERLIFRKLRATLFGKRIRYLTSGAAPLSLEVLEFFHAIGLPLYEGYGLTETSSPITLNRPEQFRLGTVGPALPESEMKIAADGEILLRGPGVFREYFREPEATRAAIDAEGWFHSGDIGEIDNDGFLRITDRKKNLIVTAGGKNIAPANIELLLLNSPYINGAMVYGDRRKYLVAVLTLDEAAIFDWADRNGRQGLRLPELVQDEGVQALIQAEVELVNAQLARYETIKYFHLAPEEFTVANGMLTPTLKLKRQIVQATYAAELNQLYDEALAPPPGR